MKKWKSITIRVTEEEYNNLNGFVEDYSRSHNKVYTLNSLFKLIIFSVKNNFYKKS